MIITELQKADSGRPKDKELHAKKRKREGVVVSASSIVADATNGAVKKKVRKSEKKHALKLQGKMVGLAKKEVIDGGDGQPLRKKQMKAELVAANGAKQEKPAELDESKPKASAVRKLKSANSVIKKAKEHDAAEKATLSREEKRRQYKQFCRLRLKLKKHKKGGTKNGKEVEERMASKSVVLGTEMATVPTQLGSAVGEKATKKKNKNWGRCDVGEFCDEWKTFLNEAQLSQVEVDDADMKEDYFGAQNSTAADANEFLSRALPKWRDFLETKDLTPGAPQVVIVCQSAIRACDLNRELKKFKTKMCSTAKLFGKHLKLKHQAEHLKTCVTHLAIGSPHRISALLTDGSLKQKNLRALVLDWQWRNEKRQRLVDVNEVKRDLFDFVRRFIVPLAKKDKVKVLLL